MTPLARFITKKLGNAIPAGQEHQHQCPFCVDRVGSESAQRKLWVNYTKGKAICYRCDYRAASLRRLAEDINGAPLPPSLLKDELEAPDRPEGYTLYGSLLMRFFQQHQEQCLKPHRLPLEYRPLWQLYRDCQSRPALALGLRYLAKRKADPDAVEDYKVGYAVGGRYAGSLIFPVYEGQQVVYFTSRFCGKREPKSLNPKNIEGYRTKADVLLNYDNVRGQPVVALCEGPFSAMAYRHAVASFGKTLSEAQVVLIARLVREGLREMVVSYDADAVSEATTTAARLAGVVPTVTVARFAAGDPDDNRTRLREIIARRRPLTLAAQVSARIA